MDTNDQWKSDPRLNDMDSAKIEFLTQFADRVQNLNKDQLLPAFTNIQKEAKSKGIEFNEAETALLMSVITAKMSPTELKRFEMLRNLAQKMAAKKSR